MILKKLIRKKALDWVAVKILPKPGFPRILFIISILLFVHLQYPLGVSGENNMVCPQPENYEAYDELVAIQNEIEDRRSDPRGEITNKTQKRLVQDLAVVDYDAPEIAWLDFETADVVVSDPEENMPSLYSDIRDFEALYGKGTLLEWLMDRGTSNYYIYTRYDQNYQFTKDYLRPILIPPDLGTGSGIDLDNDTTTGDSAGNDVFISLRPEIEISKLPTLLPLNRSLELVFRLRLDITRLRELKHPLTVHVIKYVSYNERNYLFNLGADLYTVPSEITMMLHSENVVIELAPARDVLRFVNNYIINGTVTIDNSSLIGALRGPYHISYEMPYLQGDIYDRLSLYLGINELRNDEITKISWANIVVKRGTAKLNIPFTGHIRLDTPNIIQPVNELYWEGLDHRGYRTVCDLEIRYFDSGKVLTYAEVLVEDMPGWVNIEVDYQKTVGDINVTPLSYRSSHNMRSMLYRNTQYYSYPSLKDIRTMEVFIDHLPTSFDMEITSDVNRNLPDMLNVNNSLPITVRLLDNFISNIASRFSRIGATLETLSDSLTQLPQSGGWIWVKAGGKEPYFGQWDFKRTSSTYLRPRSGVNSDHLCFYDLKDPDLGSNTSGLRETTALSVKLSNVGRINLNFSKYTIFEVDFVERSPTLPFRILLVGGEKGLQVRFSNLPDSFGFYVVENGIDILSRDDMGKPQQIRELEMIYQFEKRYFQMKLEGVKGGVSYRERDGELSAYAPIPLDMLEFHVTDNRDKGIKELNGNSIYMHQEEDAFTLSGRLRSLKNLTYKPGSKGYFHLNYENETSFGVDLYSYLDNGSQAKLIIDPLPTNFTFDLPGSLDESSYQLPDLVSVTGDLNLSSVIDDVTDLLYDIVDLSFNVTSTFLDNIGSISNRFNFSYTMAGDRTLDIIGYMKKGDISGLGPTHWVHGVSMSQGEVEGETVLEGRVYLQGMPPKGSISTNMIGDDVDASLSFQGWRPENPWVLLELSGIQDRDVVVYVNGLKSNIDFHMDVDFHTNMSIGGRIQGNVSIRTTSNPGQFYIRFVKYGSTTSATEMLLSSVPRSVSIQMTLFNQFWFRYSATDPIKFIYFTNSRLIEGIWYSTQGILHDVVEYMEMEMEPPRNMDISSSVLIQSMPYVRLYSWSKDPSTEGILDLHLSLQGRSLGQTGDILVDIRNTKDITARSDPDSGEFRINSSGTEYLRIQAVDLKLMRSFSLDEIKITCVDLRDVSFEMEMLFGVYPIFSMKGVKLGFIQMQISGTIRAFGRTYRMDSLLVDMASSFVPTGVSAYNDQFMIESDSRKHIITPAPIITLWLTILE